MARFGSIRTASGTFFHAIPFKHRNSGGQSAIGPEIFGPEYTFRVLKCSQKGLTGGFSGDFAIEVQDRPGLLDRKGENAMNIKPLSDRVVVQALQNTEEKIGSIIVPDSAKEKPLEGTIKAVGPGRTEEGQLIPMSVKTGDRVLYGKYSGTEVKIGGEEYLIIRESDVMALLD